MNKHTRHEGSIVVMTIGQTILNTEIISQVMQVLLKDPHVDPHRVGIQEAEDSTTEVNLKVDTHRIGITTTVTIHKGTNQTNTMIDRMHNNPREGRIFS